MITFYKLFALIFSAMGKLIAKLVTLLTIVIKSLRHFQISNTEQNYKNNPSEYNRILYENAQLRVIKGSDPFNKH